QPFTARSAQTRRPDRGPLRCHHRRRPDREPEKHGDGRSAGDRPGCGDCDHPAGEQAGMRRQPTAAMKHAPRPNSYRDTWAGQLDASRAETPARVSGWVHRRRDHGGLIFIDLRERSGIVQLVFNPATAPEAHQAAHSLRSEDVITAAGTVARRAPENVNPNLKTGQIEVAVRELEIDRKSTRLNSSHRTISYAVFCLK